MKTQRILVDWDGGTDEGYAPESDLPARELDLPYELVWEELDGISAEGSVADYLSDEYGWCVDGWEAIDPSSTVDMSKMSDAERIVALQNNL